MRITNEKEEKEYHLIVPVKFNRNCRAIPS